MEAREEATPASSAGKRGTGARDAGGCFLVLFGIAWTAGIMAFDWLAGGMFLDQWRTETFVPVTGTVTGGEVEESSGDEGTSYHPKIAYEYTVAGRTWRNDKYRFGMMPGSSEHAYREVEDHPPGSAITVYYDPQDPSRSVLKQGLSPGDRFMLLFMVPFNVAMFGFWIVGWRRIRRTLRPGVAGGATIIECPEGVRVRVHDATPLMGAGIVAGLLAFVSVFGIMIFSSWLKNSMAWAVQGAWALTLIGALWAYVSGHIHLRRGDYDIVLHDLRNTVVLPPMLGRRKALELDRSRIRAVRTDREETKKGHEDETPSKFHTVIDHREGNGPDVSVRAAEWSDEERAEEFAAWLRERLNLPAAPQGPSETAP